MSQVMAMNAPINVKGVIYRGKTGYSIAAQGYPIFAFGKSLDIVQVRWVKACHVYFGTTRQAPAIMSGAEYPILESEHLTN